MRRREPVVMSSIVRRAALVATLAVAVSLSGCIVCPWCWECDDRPPRMAMIYVHVSDYYTGAPISWAAADLYESDWWEWDFIGTWEVNGSGRATLYGGYLYDEGDGPEEEDFKVVVYASGYETLDYTLELDFWHPTETLHFYLLPYYAREGEEPDVSGENEPGEDGPDGPRVLVGEPREGLPTR